eukprot:Amastigsp_a179800_9.p1 type:complete len:135 gc:universal Amastigsp_a179800_9:288-692(+)
MRVFLELEAISGFLLGGGWAGGPGAFARGHGVCRWCGPRAERRIAGCSPGSGWALLQTTVLTTGRKCKPALSRPVHALPRTLCLWLEARTRVKWGMAERGHYTNCPNLRSQERGLIRPHTRADDGTHRARPAVG